MLSQSRKVVLSRVRVEAPGLSHESESSQPEKSESSTTMDMTLDSDSADSRVDFGYRRDTQPPPPDWRQRRQIHSRVPAGPQLNRKSKSAPPKFEYHHPTDHTRPNITSTTIELAQITMRQDTVLLKIGSKKVRPFRIGDAPRSFVQVTRPFDSDQNDAHNIFKMSVYSCTII